MATIDKLPNGKFKVRIRAGQRILKTRTFTRRTDARAWALRIEGDREYLASLGEPGMRQKLSEYLPDYLKAWRGNDPARKTQLRWWIAALADKPFADVSKDDVRRALDRYAAGKALRPDRKPGGKHTVIATKRERSPASVNRMKATLSSFFKYAIAAGIVSRNPVTGIAALPERNQRTRWLTEDERTALLAAACDSDWDKLYLLILMALMTGARKGELLSLRWEAIDFQIRTVTLPRTKNGDARTLSFPMPVIEELLRHRKTAGLVFVSDTNPFGVASIRKPWTKALTTAGIEGFRFHDLRHSAASYLAMNNASLLEIAHVLGHRSVQTTKRYAHLSAGHVQALTDRVLGVL